MAELFSISGESENVGSASPVLVGNFIPALDNSRMADGFGIVYPFGSGSTARGYLDYGQSAEASSYNTLLSDLSQSFASGRGGLTYNIEGFIGPQGLMGPQGLQGLPGVSIPMYSPPNGLFALSNTLQQIEALGTAIDQMIYTSAFEYTYTWTIKGPTDGPAQLQWANVACDSDMSNIIVSQTARKVLKSIDYGDNWTDITPVGEVNSLHHRVASDSDGSVLAVAIGNNKSFYISTDSGVNWTARHPKPGAPPLSENWWAAALDSDGSFVVAGEYIGRLFTSVNTGANWTERQPAGDINKKWISAACDSDGSHIVVVNEDDYTKIYISLDSGVNWSGKVVTGVTLWENVACNADGTVMVAVGLTNIVYISTDSGSNWNRVYPLGAGSHSWTSVAISSNGKTILVGGRTAGLVEVVYSSFDTGTTWNLETVGSGSSFFYGAALSDDGSIGVLTRSTINGSQFIFTSVSYGEATWAETTITAFARTLVDDATAAEAATTLGLGTGDSPTFTGLTLSGLTDNNLIYSASDVLTSLGAATNGQIPIGSTGAAPVLAGLTGTANQITVTNGAGTITLATPQDIHTGANPQFATLGLGTAAGSFMPIYFSTSTAGIWQVSFFNTSTAAAFNLMSFRLRNDVPSTLAFGVSCSNNTYATANYGQDGAFITWSGVDAFRFVMENATAANNDIRFIQGAGGTVETFVFTGTGKLGIGVASPTTALDVNGVITATGGTSTNWNTAYTHSQVAGGDSVHVSVTENSNWDTAYGWGNHASAGYLTSPVAIANGGTGQTTQQTAINALTNVAAATNEHVLTKDTATGNAVFKAASGAANAFVTITGITNDVVADAAADTLTLASANAALTVVGTTATDTITFTVVEAQIIHDNLSGFVANEHIDHSGVSILAGTGMSGGGDITASRTLNCSITQYTDELAQDAVGTILTNSSSVNFTYDDVLNTITAVVLPAGVDHDSLLNFAAAEHLSLPNTITNVLSDHNLAAHTGLGLFDQSSDVDHDQTTNVHQNVNTAASPTFVNTYLTGSLRLPDGGQIYTTAGPSIVLDATNDYLEITDCNVGIGTQTPASLLHILGSGGRALFLQSAGTTNLYCRTLNAGNDLYWGVDGSAGGLFTGVNAYGAFLITGGAKDLQFGTNSTVKMTIDLNGNVGIGTTAPNAMLHMSPDGLAVAASLITSDPIIISQYNTAPGLSVISAGPDVGDRAVFKGVRSDGTLAVPTVPAANDQVLTIGGAIFDGTITQLTGAVDFYVDGAVSSGVAPCRVSFVTSATNAASRTERMIISSNGNIGIGNLGATQPEGQLEIYSATPTFFIHNTTHTDAIGARECAFTAKGEQSGGEISTLGTFKFAHDTALDDEAGRFIISVNDGNDGDTPGTALTIKYDKRMFIYGSLYMQEKAAATADGAGYGQLWVKNTTPCQLWFTDDAGTDTQIV